MAATNQRIDSELRVRDLGQRWAEAEARTDAEALAPLLAEDFTLVGPLGFVLDKPQYLGSRRSGDLRQDWFSWEDVGVRVYGGTAVAVGTQVQRSAYQGRDASGRFRVTLIAVEQDGRWVVASIHLSPIAQPATAGEPRPVEAARLDVDDLRDAGGSAVFRGADRGGFELSFILDRSQPGQGPDLHRHPYDEVWILDEGDATFTAGDRTLTAGPGSVVAVPAGTPHRFTNTGTTPLRMTCIHPRARMQTEWL